MRIGLICFDFVLPGIRMLSAYLREHGFETSIIFLEPDEIYNPEYVFSPEIKAQLANLCRQFDVIGFSVFTRNFRLAADTTLYLKQAGQPFIVWGGIHPTIDPETCVNHADAVCIGEGEESFTELLTCLKDGRDYHTLPGFWFRTGETTFRNPLRNPPETLDDLPLPDLSYEGHFIKEGQTIVPLDHERFKQTYSRYTLKDLQGNLYIYYMPVFSRGCPHSCTFCCNNYLNKTFGKHRKIVRMRGLDKIFAELNLARQLMPEIAFIRVEDDNFMAQPLDFIQGFAARWQQEIKLPFKVSASAVFVTPERLDPLVNAGLMHVQIGIQSGSDRVNKEVFRRPMTADKVLKAADVLQRYNGLVRPTFDAIFDNPFETFDDRLQTARLLQQLPKPYTLAMYSLTYYPGTELYEKALAQQIISDPEKQIFHKKYCGFTFDRVSYLKMICLIMPVLPKWLGRILVWRPLAWFGELPIWNALLVKVSQCIFWLRRRKMFQIVNGTTLFQRKSVNTSQ